MNFISKFLQNIGWYNPTPEVPQQPEVVDEVYHDAAPDPMFLSNLEIPDKVFDLNLLVYNYGYDRQQQCFKVLFHKYVQEYIV